MVVQRPEFVRKMKREKEEEAGFALPHFALHRASGSKGCRLEERGAGTNSMRLENGGHAGNG
jgi:hypothetical protein